MSQTNMQAISDVLYRVIAFKKIRKATRIDDDTFRKLLEIYSCNVLMPTDKECHRQKDGLTMGCQPAPLLAKWLDEQN